MNKDDENENGLPPIVWKSILAGIAIFLLLCMLTIAYAHHRSFLDFYDAFIADFTVILKVGCVLLVLFYGHKFLNSAIVGHHTRRKLKGQADRAAIQNTVAQAKLKLIEELPAVMHRAIDAGMNIKFEGFEATRWESNLHTIASPLQQQKLLPPGDFIPEPYKFSDVLRSWEPTKDGILLAKGHELITTPIGEGLCHTTFTGATDGGKTNNERLLLIQLLFLGQIVYLCDRNYQQYRLDSTLNCYYDYGPIATQLAYEPIVKASQGLALLKHLLEELEDRRARRRHNRVSFPDIYSVWDELPAFCYEEGEIMPLVGKFLRESRQYGIFFIAAAQDLLNNTLSNDNGAVRDNLLTNFYSGGDDTTARMVLNLKKGETIDETGLGVKGVNYLRSKGASIDHAKVRTPLSDDLATTMLLNGRAPVTRTLLLPEPIEVVKTRKATLQDALDIRKELGEMGRVKLCEELTGRGLDCSDDLARQLLRNIADREKK